MTHPKESFPLQQSSPMAKQSMAARCKASGITDGFIFIGGAVVALLLVWSCWSFVSPASVPSNFPSILSTDLNVRALKDDKNEPLLKCTRSEDETHRGELETPTFYDDPALTYMVEQKLTNWDAKRQQWLRDHPSLTRGAGERVLLVTGSQPRPCQNPVGDHFLLRFFKNKVDYCRINGCDLYYNNALLHPKMTTFWAKIPLIRAAMVAHPEAEWVWWVDSDAAFTDMEFRLPLDRYRAHNFVVHAWAHLVYEKKSWVSLNAGVFLIRNCQWSLDFMERWATMGPQTPDYDKWGKIQRATTKDKVAPESDDQSGLVYLLLKEKEKWADKIYLESEYYFEGYWLDIVGKLQNITERYVAMERGVERLRRRHAEKVNGEYAEIREPYLRGAGYGKDGWRRPFITHFTGCQPCSGDHNVMYSGESCSEGMQRALNFADNQVLRNYGFARRGLLDSDHVEPLPYGYPAA
ncbi:galactomannan galactosyltransferase 1-like [Aristolochia californica]|uniref:galactomannan galactosyltransferase 1-like n=1 Tax=Aristolochia californica TaxID=171875 RepID=UPI0035DC352B